MSSEGKRLSEALDLLERVESHAEAMLDCLSDRMTADEQMRFAYQLCGLTAELTPWYEELGRQL